MLVVTSGSSPTIIVVVSPSPLASSSDELGVGKEPGVSSSVDVVRGIVVLSGSVSCTDSSWFNVVGTFPFINNGFVEVSACSVDASFPTS